MPKLILWLGVFVAIVTKAAPPVDLAGESSTTSLPRERPLTPDDLVYTENVKTDEVDLVREAGIRAN